MSRWTRFLIVLLIGLGVGLFYGWVVNPIEYVDTAPASLRNDYRADYVLMVAETYQAENNITLARQRLAFLGEASPESIVQQAMDFAVQANYAPSDLGLLRDLSDALQSQILNRETPLP